jgi:hypothetical protein
VVEIGWACSSVGGNKNYAQNFENKLENNLLEGVISGSPGGEYEDDFWEVALCSLVEVY